MFVRVAFNPGPEHQQRLHQSDMELPHGTSDEAVIAEVERYHINIYILGIAVWDGDEWRTIHGTLPKLRP